jgi:hypothetical protein
MSSIATLGDAGASNDDASYTGDVSTSPLSVDWFRTKYTEFQGVMNALDASYQAGLYVHSQIEPTERIDELLTDYERKSGEIKTLAETLNLGASAANAIGVRMPVLSIPQTLGVLPAFVVPAVVATAAAAVAGWIAYARGYASAMAEAIAEVESTVTDPTQRAAVVAALESKRQEALQSVSFISGSPLSMLAGPLQIVIIGGLAFFAYRAFVASRGN